MHLIPKELSMSSQQEKTLNTYQIIYTCGKQNIGNKLPDIKIKRVSGSFHLKDCVF
jgi:hypothetical protein